jgi:hypothetical protein
MLWDLIYWRGVNDLKFTHCKNHRKDVKAKNATEFYSRVEVGS